MADPALEAVKRLPDHHGGVHVTPTEYRGRLDGAREALAPVRKLHRSANLPGWGGVTRCGHDHKEWPCATARLVYTSEELNQ